MITWKSEKNKTKMLICIFIIALVFRVPLLFLFKGTPLTIVDERHYHAISENILVHHEFSMKAGHPTAIRPPLYPAFLAMVYSLAGKDNHDAVRIVQILLSLGIVFAVYLLAKELFDRRIAFLSAAIFSCYPTYLFFTVFLLAEVLFTFLFFLFVWFFLRFFVLERGEGEGNLMKEKDRDKGWGWGLSSSAVVFFSGLFLGLAALTRSILYPFLPIALIWIAIFSKKTLRFKVKSMLLFFLGYAIVMGPWAMRNTRLFGEPVMVGTMGGLNLYMGNYEHTPLNRAWAAVDITGENAWYRGHEGLLAGMNEAQKQKWAVKQAKQFMMDHKLLTLKRSIIKAANFWGLERSVSGAVMNGHWPGLSGWGVLIPLTLVIFSGYCLVAIGGVFGLVFNIGRHRIDILFIVIMIAFFTGMHALVFGHSRYHLPLMPFLMIFAAWSFTYARQVFQNRNDWPFGVSLIVSALLILVWGREVFLIDGARFLEHLK